MKMSFLHLEEELKSKCGNKPVYYLPNSGNWGDGLIRLGTMKFFRDIGLEYREMKPDKKNWIIPKLRGGTVIFGGGGAWCSYWERARNLRALKKISPHYRTIILPSTYEKNYNWENTVYWRRDKFESKDNMPGSKFCHDMAFYLGSFEAPKGEGVGYFFRRDKESSGKIKIPDSNVDLSSKGDHYTPMYLFFKKLSSYEKIYTDRLHVAIASCLLGREVHLFSSSYFKIRAVYKSSIRDYFNNVYFHGTEQIDQL